MAQLLYTEWFVRFQFPNHENVKMVESGTEYGEVPEGWEVKKFDKAINVNPIIKIKNKENVLHIPMECLSNTISSIDTSKAIRKDNSTGRKFQNEDTLFARITPCFAEWKKWFC